MKYAQGSTFSTIVDYGKSVWAYTDDSASYEIIPENTSAGTVTGNLDRTEGTMKFGPYYKPTVVKITATSGELDVRNYEFSVTPQTDNEFNEMMTATNGMTPEEIGGAMVQVQQTTRLNSGGISNTFTGFMKGVNLAGAEFDHANLPGTYGTNYAYPDTDSVDYFVNLGFKLIRIPFRMERLMPTMYGDLDTDELDRLLTLIDYIRDVGGTAVVDPHNYAGYYGEKINADGSSYTSEALADFWSKLAAELIDRPDVVLLLNNEPSGVTIDEWFSAASDAVTAIRKTGAVNLIQVPGISYTSANSFVSNGSLAAYLDYIKDPLKNTAVEVHMYLDKNNSGTTSDVSSDYVGENRLRTLTYELRKRGITAFLGEWNGGDNNSTEYSTALNAIRKTHDFMVANKDVWAGYCLWAGGDRWGDSYIHQLQPIGGPLSGNDDRLRTSILAARGTDLTPEANYSVYYSFQNDVLIGEFDVSDIISVDRSGSALIPNFFTGVLEKADEDTPRISDKLGLLIEPTRTNYANSLVELETNTKLAVSDKYPSPDGTNNAKRLLDTAVDGWHVGSISPSVWTGVTVGNEISVSLYFREYEYSTNNYFSYLKWSKPDTYSVRSPRVSYGYDDNTMFLGDWGRHEKTFTPRSPFPEGMSIGINPDSNPNQGHRADSYVGDGETGHYVFGLQVESGKFPTSPILATSYGAKTRNADVVDIVGTALDVIGGTKFTVVIETYLVPVVDSDNDILVFSDGTNEVSALRRASDGTLATSLASTELFTDALNNSSWLNTRKIAISVDRTAGSEAVVIAADGHAAVSISDTISDVVEARFGAFGGYVKAFGVVDDFYDTAGIVDLLNTYL